MDRNWCIEELAFDSKNVPKYETLFTLGNGYLGIRGSFEEQQGVYKPGTFINGFYETEPIIYGEHGYGYAKNRQRMIPVTDGTAIQIYLDGELFSLTTGTVNRYYRFLDMRSGVLTREVEWESPKKKCFSLIFKRVLSSTRLHTAVLQISVKPLQTACTVHIISSLYNNRSFTSGSIDPRVGNILQQNPIVLVRKTIDSDQGMMKYKTRNSGLTYVCSMAHNLVIRGTYDVQTEKKVHALYYHYVFPVEKEETIRAEKFLSYYTSLDTPPTELNKKASEEVQTCKEAGFNKIVEENTIYLQSFWKDADIRIKSSENLQESIRFNMYHLLQAAGKTGTTNVPAKGLTGEGYEGHYFWDTEIYLLPFFTYTIPDLARNLLIYRYSTLPAARERARELHHKGALYPWRTINGHEASPYFPAGTAQYHINADISYACRKYWNITGDDAFMVQYGGEILFETARFWADFSNYIPNKGYCFNCVTGPDEYTALVNNNAYTNYMARMNLLYAAEAAAFMTKNHPDDFTSLSNRLELSTDEIETWKKMAADIYIPYDTTRKLIPQDDSFLQKAVWDFDSVPEDHYPLLLHYHPLTIYRYQVLKQPDLVLAFLLLSGLFSKEEKLRNYEYYNPLTTGDSSLASCIQSIIATEIGKIEEGERYFLKTARMDLDDINKNVKDGIHAAAMGGTWLTLIYGFAGLRDEGDLISFAPHLPPSIGSLDFVLKIHNQKLAVCLSGDQISYTLTEGEGLTILHYDEIVKIQPGKPVFLHIYAH